MKNFFIFLLILCCLSTIIWIDNERSIKTNQAANVYNLVNNTTHDQNLSDDELKQKIGQMIMVGFSGSSVNENSNIVNIVKNIKIGGVILFNRNSSSNIINYQQTKDLINDLQKYSSLPLFVAVDAEGGQVNRLKNIVQIKSAYEMGDNATNEITHEEADKLAHELHNLGFNMNLAPVVDVNVNIHNPAIGGLDRSFSDNPNNVVYQATNFILNHYKYDILTVAKHFPGQGNANADTHQAMVDISKTYNQMELIPYQELNKNGLLKAVMVGHLINKNIDPIYPASLSPKFIQTILRDQIGFNGIVISDDLHMLAIKNNYHFDDAVIMAINAGVDIVLATKNMSSSYENNTALQIQNIIFEATRSGKIEIAKINESYDRIIGIKRQFHIIDK